MAHWTPQRTMNPLAQLAAISGTPITTAPGGAAESEWERRLRESQGYEGGGTDAMPFDAQAPGSFMGSVARGLGWAVDAMDAYGYGKTPDGWQAPVVDRSTYSPEALREAISDPTSYGTVDLNDNPLGGDVMSTSWNGVGGSMSFDGGYASGVATDPSGATASGAGIPGGGFHKGGSVTRARLAGPNPQGPDDGYAALDAGEYVMQTDAVQRYGQEVMQAINDGRAQITVKPKIVTKEQLAKSTLSLRDYLNRERGLVRRREVGPLAGQTGTGSGRGAQGGPTAAEFKRYEIARAEAEATAQADAYWGAKRAKRLAAEAKKDLAADKSEIYYRNLSEAMSNKDSFRYKTMKMLDRLRGYPELPIGAPPDSPRREEQSQWDGGVGADVQQLARMGRGGDTELVHMTKGEVAGMQDAAQQHGGSLTRNPETGLHEAFILEALGIGASLYSGYKGRQQARQLSEQAQAADTWGQSGGRAMAGQQLQQLMQDPGQISASDPGYKMRIQGAQRAMAPQGQDSGAMAVAAAGASSDWYNQRLQQLGTLAGAPGQPGIALQGQQMANQQWGQAMGDFDAGLQQAGRWFSNPGAGSGANFNTGESVSGYYGGGRGSFWSNFGRGR